MFTSPKHDQSVSLPWELWRNRIGSSESPTAKLNLAKPLTAAMVDNIRIPSLFISVRAPKSRQGNSPYPWDFPPTQRRSFSQSVYTPHSEIRFRQLPQTQALSHFPSSSCCWWDPSHGTPSACIFLSDNPLNYL